MLSTATQTATDCNSIMNNIPKLAAKYRNSGVSERAIRRWTNENAFPVVRVGVKVLINESVFERFLRGEARE